MFGATTKALAGWCLAALWVAGTAAQGNSSAYFSFADAAGGAPGLQMAGPGAPPTILLSSKEFTGVVRAANDLATDFSKVLGGAKATVSTSGGLPTSGGKPTIIVGTIGSSDLVDQLIAAKQIDVAPIQGKWEAYISQVITDAAGQAIALAIVGSDKRGTVFGVYDISEQIGVSPWWYWGDVAPRKRKFIFAPTQSRVQGPPSIKFRGLFLNDEAPALMGWAKANFRASQYNNAFVSEFYAKIFELLLRLKGNYFWPAMWDGMFYIDDPKNGPMADEWGVFVGTSHHEPMARADKEQGRFCQGAWDWSRNKANVQRFMQEGATRSAGWNHTIYTLGMRGSGDAASATLNSASLQEVIKWQQQTLSSATKKPVSDIHQTWVMYKEVPGYWQRGMDVSDDVTLLWTDDNRGNIRRIPTAKELTRRGGSGMYYHFDYVGAPRNYKWINTIQLQKTWEQMHLSYERGIRNIWIANVGDLKALELPLDHFMAMAYDMDRFSSPQSTRAYLINWAKNSFSEAVAVTTAEIMSTYGKLTARRKYEDLSIMPFAFSTSEYDEAEANFQEWEDLYALAKKTHDSLDEDVRVAFWAMVLHPIEAGKNVFEIYTKAALGQRYAAERRQSTNALSQDARDAFQADQDLTKQFHTFLGGKWNHMMSQTHIGYNNWQQPDRNSMPALASLTGGGGGGGGRGNAVGAGTIGVGIQGSGAAATGTRITLQPITSFMPPAEKRWIDVFLRERGTATYTVTPSVPYVSVTNPNGTIKDAGPMQLRSVISVDWASAPEGSTNVELAVSAGSAAITVVVPLHKLAAPPATFAGHIESNSVVSIEANHFVDIQGGTAAASYVPIPDYGRTLAGVKLWPVTAPVQTAPAGPALVYKFYTYGAAANAKATFYLSASENADSQNPNRYAVSVDGKAVATVQPTPNSSDAGSEPPGWDNAVTRNAWIRDSQLGALAAGEHELRVWLLNPTMVLTKIVVDLGGVKSSEMGPPESYFREAA